MQAKQKQPLQEVEEIKADQVPDKPGKERLSRAEEIKKAAKNAVAKLGGPPSADFGDLAGGVGGVAIIPDFTIRHPPTPIQESPSASKPSR